MSGRYPRRRGRWIRLAGGRVAYLRRGETIPRVLGYSAFGSRMRFAPRFRPSSGIRRRSGRAYGAGVSAIGGGSGVAPTQHFGTSSRHGTVAAELKVFRQWTNPSGVSEGPSTVLLDDSGYTMGVSEIEQGSTSEQRVGFGVRAKRLTSRFRIQGPGAAGGEKSVIVRIMLLRAKNASSALDVPTVGKVFEYVNNQAAPVISPLSHSGNGKYTVLDDHRVVLNPSAETGSTACFDRIVNVDRNVVFEEGSSGADFVSGGLYYLIVADVDSEDDPDEKPQLVLNTELSFTDA